MTERNAYFDNAKGILIFLVVFGHLIDLVCTKESPDAVRFLFLLIWSFHMPAFIFLAGLFDHRRDRFPKERVMFFLALGFVLKILNMLVLVVDPDAPADFSLLSDKHFPWFMFVMAAFVVMTYGLERLYEILKKRGWTGPGSGFATVTVKTDPSEGDKAAEEKRFWVWVIVIAVAVALAAGYVSWIGDFLYLSRIFVFFPVYALGYTLSADEVAKFMDRSAVKMVGWIGLIVTAVVFWTQIDLIYHLRPLFTGRNAYSEWGLAHGGPWLRLAAYGISTSVTFFFLAVVPKRNCFLSRIGRESLCVYACHYYVIYLLNGLGVIDALSADRLRIMLPAFILIAATETYLLSRRIR